MKETSKATSRTRVSSVAIAIEFDHRKIIAALVNENCRVIDEREIATPQRTTRATAAEITKLIVDLAVSQSRAGCALNAIGFSVAGIVDPPTGRVSIPELKNWTRVALLQMIEEGLKGAGVDIRIPPDEKRARAKLSDSPHPAMVINSRAATMAAGEAWAGAARGKNNVVYLSIGEQIEAGIIVDWRVVQGAGGLAGAAGWLALSEGFKQEFESRGCLTAEAASAALKRRVIEGWDGSVKSVIGNVIKDDMAHLDDAAIIRAARGSDALALNSVNATCRWIGRGVANLISILNPDVIVIGGRSGLMLKPYLDEIREEATRWIMPASARQSRIVNATLGNKAALLGAARLAFLKTGVTVPGA
ncbi:MAG TPA: ROK family protein [Blastocatellia bacterium]|nr:ROK family protein [Blastocatellia bacterium]